jgi:hypothetical protein
MAAVLEYLTVEVLELSGSDARDNKKTKIPLIYLVDSKK